MPGVVIPSGLDQALGGFMFKRHPEAAKAPPLKIPAAAPKMSSKRNFPPPPAPGGGGSLMDQIKKRASQRRSRVNPDSDSLANAGIDGNALSALQKEAAAVASTSSSSNTLADQLKARARGMKSRVTGTQRAALATKKRESMKTSPKMSAAAAAPPSSSSLPSDAADDRSKRSSVGDLRLSIGAKLGLLPKKPAHGKTSLSSSAAAAPGKVSDSVKNNLSALLGLKVAASPPVSKKTKRVGSIERSSALDSLLTNAFAKKMKRAPPRPAPALPAPVVCMKAESARVMNDRAPSPLFPV